MYSKKHRNVVIILTTACFVMFIKYSRRSSNLVIHESIVYNVSVPSYTTTRQYKMKPTCHQPFTRVAFLKVHKAGSTTVMNIFLRFGSSHKLNIALPQANNKSGWNYLGFGTSVQEERIIPIPENETYHILCNHVRYNKEKFKDLLGEDSINIGIIRDPFTHFLSAASYYGLLSKLRTSYRNISDQQRISLHLVNANLTKRDELSFTHNRMSFDFGLDVRYFYNSSIINIFLQNLGEDFKLVMLTEYFDESLILLKRILCWDLKDILYVPLNINKVRVKHPIILTQKDKEILFQYNYADFMLYQFFKKRFLEQISEAGNDFITELEHFKQIHKSVTYHCHSMTLFTDLSDMTVYRANASAWNKEFNVSLSDCRFMMSDELLLLRKLAKEAENRYNFSIHMTDQ